MNDVETQRKESAEEIVNIRKKIASFYKNDLEVNKIRASGSHDFTTIDKEILSKTNADTRNLLKEIRNLHHNFVSDKQENHYVINETNIGTLINIIDTLESGSGDIDLELKKLSERDDFKKYLSSMSHDGETLKYLENLYAVFNDDFVNLLDEYRAINNEMSSIENGVVRKPTSDCVYYRELAHKWYQLYSDVGLFKLKKTALSETVAIIREKLQKEDSIMGGFFNSVSDRVIEAMTRLFPSISFTVAPMKEVSLITIVGDVDNDVADYIDKTINSEGIAVHVSCGKLVQSKVAEETDIIDLNTVINERINDDAVETQCAAAKENLYKIFESGFYSPSESRDYHFLPLDRDFIKENILKREQPMVTVSSSDAEPINVGDWITFGTDDGKSIVKTPLCVSKIVNRKNGYFILVLERISTGNK